MKKYDVYEMQTDFNLIGEAKQTETDIEVRFEDRILLLKEKKEELERDHINNENKIKSLSEISPLLEKGKVITNEITQEVTESYNDCIFYNNILAEIGSKLNHRYDSIMSRKTLRKEISEILGKFGLHHKNAVFGYIKYFILDGLIERRMHSRYAIVKNNLIPKPKKEYKDRGIFDELGM